MRIHHFNNFTTDTGYILLAYLVKIIETFFFFWKRNLVNMSVKCHQGKGKRGEAGSVEPAGSWSGGVSGRSGGSTADVGYRTG